jgi:hypothetical protein
MVMPLASMRVRVVEGVDSASQSVIHNHTLPSSRVWAIRQLPPLLKISKPRKPRRSLILSSNGA